jgi:hypothetical protein
VTLACETSLAMEQAMREAGAVWFSEGRLRDRGRPHPSAAIRMYMGDSRGHWDGDTLVVETTNFTDKVAIGSNGAGYPGDPGYHSEALHLTERFTRTGENTLDYTATVNDPQTWTRPWTLLIVLTRSRDAALFEYACHEGNYAMRNILSGARADEAAKHSR